MNRCQIVIVYYVIRMYVIISSESITSQQRYNMSYESEKLITRRRTYKIVSFTNFTASKYLFFLFQRQISTETTEARAVITRAAVMY